MTVQDQEKLVQQMAKAAEEQATQHVKRPMHYQVFQLARRLRGIPGVVDYMEPDGKGVRCDLLWPIVEYWHRLAQPNSKRKDGTLEPISIEACWTECCTCWGKVRLPAGAASPLHYALQLAESEPEPPEAKLVPSKATGMRRLISLCYWLDVNAPQTPWFLTGEDAAKLLDMPKRTVAHQLKMLVSNGILMLVEKGRPKRAARYMYAARYGSTDDAARYDAARERAAAETAMLEARERAAREHGAAEDEILEAANRRGQARLEELKAKARRKDGFPPFDGPAVRLRDCTESNKRGEKGSGCCTESNDSGEENKENKRAPKDFGGVEPFMRDCHASRVTVTRSTRATGPKRGRRMSPAETSAAAVAVLDKLRKAG
jgi:hypothetical protein